MPSPAADTSSDERRARRVAAMRRRRRRRQIQRVSGLAIILAAVGVAALVLSAGSDTIPGGVRIAGVDVGGLSGDEARAKLTSVVDTDLGRTIRLTDPEDGETILQVEASELASGADVDEAVNAAVDARGRFGRAVSRIGLAPRRDVPLNYTLREAGLNDVVTRTSAEITQAPRAATVRVRAGALAVTESQPGRRVDRPALTERLRALPESLEVPVSTITPAPDDAEAERARALGERIRATGRDVTLGNRTTLLTPRAQTNALRFPAKDGKIDVQLNNNVLRSALIAGLGIREAPPRDARITVNGNVARVVPSQPGTTFDAADLGTKIVANPDQAAVTARVTRTPPKFTTKDAQALRIREKVGEFTTQYACCQNRTVNIQVAARAINGTILKSGERFSLNDALGERTAEKGYLEAPMIAGDQLVDSRGGGISQVATTVYNAAFFSGLEIIAHTPHSFYISRYPKGREATISSGSPDLVFRNDWDAAVYIAASAGENAITVSMYSSKLGRRVETETGDSTNPVAPKTIERSNSSLEPGTRKVIQSAGSSGFSVSYTRKVFRGAKLHRDETYRWTYRPQNAIIEIGPPLPATPTEPDADTPGDGTTTTTTPTPTTTGSTTDPR